MPACLPLVFRVALHVVVVVLVFVVVAVFREQVKRHIVDKSLTTTSTMELSSMSPVHIQSRHHRVRADARHPSRPPKGFLELRSGCSGSCVIDVCVVVISVIRC